MNIRGEINEGSNIQQFYTGKCLFLTGATGFLGTAIIEKLLRSCPGIKKIYILLKPRKDRSVEDRFANYFNDSVFDTLKEQQPKSFEKVNVISGNLSLSNLGVSKEDTDLLIKEVNCIIHSAATVHFTQNLKTAIDINLKGTRELLNIARNIAHLQRIVHVSTAYSFCINPVIEEIVYDIPIEPEDIIRMSEIIDSTKFSKFESIILDKWPNSYVFTKALTERMIIRSYGDLPICIVRPSIIISTAKEPTVGWLKGYNGGALYFSTMYLGMTNVVHANLKNRVDIVPVDYVSNHIIAAGWDVAITGKVNAAETSTVPIYNIVNGQENPTNWSAILALISKYDAKVPSMKKIWHQFCFTSSSDVVLRIHDFIHLMIAFAVDICHVKEQSRLFVTTRKMQKLMSYANYFSSRSFNMKNCNTQKLAKRLSAKDKEIFNFDVKNLCWDSVFYNFILAIRVCLLQDPMSTIPKAQMKSKYLRNIHYSAVFILTIAFTFLFYFILQLVYSI